MLFLLQLFTIDPLRRNNTIKGPAKTGPFRLSQVLLCDLRRDDVGCTWAFLALPDLELDLLAFIKRGIAVGFNLRVVNKQIISSIIGDNKTESLLCIEPFYFSCTHVFASRACLQAAPLISLISQTWEAYSREMKEYGFTNSPLSIMVFFA